MSAILLSDEFQASQIAKVPHAAYIVETAWGQGTSGLFRFGISQFGSSTDLFAADSWSAAFTGQYDQLSAIARDITINRGRDNDLSTFRAGSGDTTLRDAAGIYNPYNAASPLAASIDTDKPSRIAAVLDGVTYPLYYGFLTDIEGDPSGRGTVHLSNVDFLDKLDRQSPVFSLPGGSTDGQIIGAILDWFQWTDPAMRSLTTGDTINAAYTRADGSRTGLALVSELMESERGIVYVNAAGAVAYRDRASRYLSVSQGTIDRTLTAFAVGKSNANIVNQWTVQRTDMAGNNVGVPQTAIDATSSRIHGPVAQTITTPFLNTDSQALSLAQYLLLRTRTGMQLVYEVPISIPDKATLIQVLSRDIGDRVTLTIAPRNMPQITGDFYIESITHTISASGAPRHACSWRVSQVPSTAPFRFGSKFGSTDVFTY